MSVGEELRRLRLRGPASGLVAVGSGLGLTLVRRIAVAHGGTVSAEPREGGGMRFRLSLPI